MEICIDNNKLKLCVDTFGAKVLYLKCKDDDKDLLLSHDKDLQGGDNIAMFPMLPICNRVRNDSYVLDFRVINLPQTAPDKSEYVHGIGWISDFELVSHQESKIVLALHGLMQDYDFTAQIIYELDDNCFKASMSITHNGTLPLLYGIGFHPYFKLENDDIELKIDASGYFKEGAGHFSTDTFVEDRYDKFIYKDFKKVDKSFVNHIYTAFSKATLVNYKDNYKLTLEADNCPYLMTYHLKNGNFIALEPMTHPIDACNQKGHPALSYLAKGSSLKMTMTIKLETP